MRRRPRATGRRRARRARSPRPRGSRPLRPRPGAARASRPSQRAPGRLHGPCVALLAGWGLDDLTSRGARRRRASCAALACCCSRCSTSPRGRLGRVRTRCRWPGASPRRDWRRPRPATSSGWPRSWSGSWCRGGARAAGLRARAARGAAFAALALALVARPVQGRHGLQPGDPGRHAAQPTTAAIRFLQDQRPARFAGLPTAPISLAVPLTPSVAMRYGVYDARGYDYPVELRYADLWKRVITPSDLQLRVLPRVGGTTPRRCRRSGCSACRTSSSSGATGRCAGSDRVSTRSRRTRLRQPRRRCRGRSSSTARLVGGRTPRATRSSRRASGRARSRDGGADRGPGAGRAAGRAGPAGAAHQPLRGRARGGQTSTARRCWC